MGGGQALRQGQHAQRQRGPAPGQRPGPGAVGGSEAGARTVGGSEAGSRMVGGAGWGQKEGQVGKLQTATANRYVRYQVRYGTACY